MKARVLLWTKDAWWSKRFTVASQNTTASTLTLTQAPAQIDSIYSLTANQKAFVENDLALLDTPGEFYYDTTSGFLYYSPIGGIIPRTGIWVAETPTLLSISNMRNITFKNMGFRYTAMDISGDLNMNANGVSAKGAIDFWQGTNIKFDKCRFQSLGSQGISISNSSEVSIVNSKFHSIGFSAVKINGGMLSRNRTAKKNSVLSSRVYNSGEEYTSFAAIDIFNSSENKISHNHVLGNPGRCMNINSQPFSSMPSIIEGIPVTHTNQWDFNPTENNEISYNLVETCMKEASDGGGIYSGGAGRGNKFLYNVVRNVGNTLHDRVLINLIYLDDGTSYSEVFGNIAYGIIVPTSNINNPYKASYSMNSKGISNVIENNIFDYTGGFGGFYNWNMIPIDQSHDLTIKKNIFITNGPQNTVYDFVEEADFNLIWHASNSVVRRWRGGKPNISNSSFSTNCTLNMNPGWSLNMSSCTTNTGPIVFDTHSIISSTYPFQGSYFPGNVEFSTSSNIPTLLGFEPLSLNQAADLTGNPYLN
jgi:hypothetical protein